MSILVEHILDRVTSSVKVNRCDIAKYLTPYLDIISNMSETSIDKLVYYLVREIIPSRNIGMCYAQQLLHGITQSSLSGKVATYTEYLPIMDVLEMSSTNAVCIIEGNYDKVLQLEDVRIKDLIRSIDHVDRHPNWVKALNNSTIYKISDYDIVGGGTCIMLKKDIMSKFSITMGMIRTCIVSKSQYSREILVSPNLVAELYIDDYHRGSMLSILSAIDDIIISGIPNLKIIGKCNDKYCCSYLHYKELISISKHMDIKVKCNDINTVFIEDGYDKCKQLIIDSLTANDDVSIQCATVVCNYMMVTYKPLPFNKSSIKSIYGPMFDMYYATPIETIIKWVLSGEEDQCSSPYTKLMVGSKILD